MKVILNTDIANLGEEGDVLEVSPGYARNYLLPKQLVSLHNKTNLAILKGKQKLIEKHRDEKRQRALSAKERINNHTIEFRMPAGDNGKLFGAVTSQMVTDALKKDDIEVERKKVDIPGHTLKALGNYTVNIRLYGDEEAVLSVKVLKEGDKEPKKTKAKDQDKKPVADVPEEKAEVKDQE